MLTIGQFAQIGQVTIKLLRYYDRIGLLKPVSINEETGYRYYVIEQLGVINRIMALKNLGLSLKEISNLMQDDVSLAEMRGMLKLKQAELRQHIEQTQLQLNEVETRLSLLEGDPAYVEVDVAFKSIAPQNVLSVRVPIQDGDDIDPLFERLKASIRKTKVQVGTPIGIYHPYPNPLCASQPLLTRVDGSTVHFHELPGEGLADIEAAYTLHDEPPTSTLTLSSGHRINARQLPKIDLAATIVFNGSFRERGHVYHAFAQQAEQGGYRLNGAIREVYLRVVNGNPYDPENMVEIQFPIERM